jgi:hypothetical protein
MSLQNIHLSPLIIDELYRGQLVQVTDVNAPLPVYTRPEPEPEPGPTPSVPSKPVPVKEPLPVTPVKDPEPQKPVVAPPPADIFATTPKPAPVNRQPLPATAPADARIKYLGGNKKRIAFIVNSTADVYLSETHLDWLGKLLEACHLNLGDVAIANVAKNSFSISDIKQELFSNTVILLGAEPASIQLPINFPHFNLQQHDGITFLATPPPGQLNKSTQEAKLLKSKLWVSLQKLFKL